MKRLLFAVLLISLTSLSLADTKYSIHPKTSMTYRGVTSSRSSVTGQTYYNRGRYVGRSRVNVFGGVDYYDNKGKLTYRATPNVFGGYNFRRFD